MKNYKLLTPGPLTTTETVRKEMLFDHCTWDDDYKAITQKILSLIHISFLPNIFGKHVKKIIMDKSYRNTMEIASYAGKLTGVQDLKLFERHGKEVVEDSFESTGSALDVLEQEIRLGADAVSYTHLDVYKRQMQGRIV